jgi:putative polyhydroxyalkanoate system protein
VPDIHITREHALGLAKARQLAFRWAEIAEAKLDMECTYEEGKTADLVCFKRPGASGELKVTKDSFVLDARLGLLLGIFRDRIESAIVENLDALLREKEPLHAFEKGLQKHESRHEKPAAKKAAAKPPAKAPTKATAPKKK